MHQEMDKLGTKDERLSTPSQKEAQRKPIWHDNSLTKQMVEKHVRVIQRTQNTHFSQTY